MHNAALNREEQMSRITVTIPKQGRGARVPVTYDCKDAYYNRERRQWSGTASQHMKRTENIPREGGDGARASARSSRGWGGEGRCLDCQSDGEVSQEGSRLQPEQKDLRLGAATGRCSKREAGSRSTVSSRME